MKNDSRRVAEQQPQYQRDALASDRTRYDALSTGRSAENRLTNVQIANATGFVRADIAQNFVASLFE